MAGDITNISRLVPGLIERLGGDQSGISKSVAPDSGAKFTEIFSQLIDSVSSSQQEASALQQAMLAGEPVELHQIMIKAEEAGLKMDLLLEIRNKLLNAYTELMRMPM